MDINSLILYISILNHCHSLIESQPHVCIHEKTGEPFCCFNYENQNDSCVACQVGFTAEMGSSCAPCGKMQYGYKCLKRCKCGLFQKCENVIGCQDISTLSEEKSTERSQTIEYILKTTQKEHNTSPEQSNNEFLLPQISTEISWLLIGVFVLYIIIIHSICFILSTKIKNRRPTHTDVNVNDEVGTVHYNAANDRPIDVRESITSNRNSVIVSLNEGIDLNTNNEIQDNISNETSKSSESSIDSINENGGAVSTNEVATTNTVDGYEHPYTPLIISNPNEHQYHDCIITGQPPSVPSVQTDTKQGEDYINLQLY